MDLTGRAGEDQSVVETVEVVSGGGGERVLSPGGTETTLKIISPGGALSIPSSGIIEIDPQALSLVQMASPNFDVSTVTPLSLATTQATSLTGSTILSDVQLGAKRPHSETLESSTSDVPRKKSRNYLDSHKSIEKKRRDRINNGLTTLKEMVPNCRQYASQGSKKLDKAEVLEMTIDYIHRLQQNQSSSRGNTDIETSQREWANELMSWVFHNKLLYSGPNALEQFSNALLLHLQGLGSTASSSTTTGLIYNQFPEGGSTSEEETLQNHNSLLQQLTSSENPEESNEDLSEKEQPEAVSTSTSSTHQQQQSQLAQLQALLLLQQQQQMFQGQQQQQDEGSNSTVDPQQMQQLQQLHHLQTLLLQHLANEKQATPMQDVGGDTAATIASSQPVMVTTAAIGNTGTPVELTLPNTLESSSVVYSSEDNLGSVTESSQMWSQAGHTQHVSPLLMENEGGVQEEVELLEQEN